MPPASIFRSPRYGGGSDDERAAPAGSAPRTFGASSPAPAVLRKLRRVTSEPIEGLRFVTSHLRSPRSPPRLRKTRAIGPTPSPGLISPSLLERITGFRPHPGCLARPVRVAGLSEGLIRQAAGVLSDSLEDSVANHQVTELIGMDAIIVDQPVGASFPQPG